MKNKSLQDSRFPSSLSDSEETIVQSPGRDTRERGSAPAAFIPVLILPTSIVYCNSSMSYYYTDGMSGCGSDGTDSSSLTPSQELEARDNELREECLKQKLGAEATNTDISSRPWEWAQSPEFVPNPISQLTDSKMPTDQLQSLLYSTYQIPAPVSYAEVVKANIWDPWAQPSYESHDVSTRYEQCDMCMEVCLDSLDMDQQKEHRRVCSAKIEQEMEDAFAYQRSEGKACAICYEEVINKQSFSERRFGILLGCDHVFCLTCIRKWRTNSGGDKNAVRSCPLCRTHSDYVIPSMYWVDETEHKFKLTEQYQKKLSHIACRYFDEGMGTCPFGNNCFYMHAFPNGEVHKEKIRKYGNSEGEVTVVRPVCLNQFIQERENRGFS